MLLFCVSHRLPAEATQPNREEKREQRGTERAGDECVTNVIILRLPLLHSFVTGFVSRESHRS